jgi:hypothetical protein
VYRRNHVPRWNTISVSGYHMREAGCAAVQEVAFTLANAIAYVEVARAAGLEVDQVAPAGVVLLQRPQPPREVPRPPLPHVRYQAALHPDRRLS